MRTRIHILIVFLLLTIPAESVEYRALLFGLGKQEDSRWGRIHGDNDVGYVEQMLRASGYEDIRTLRNEEATKQAMVDAFKDLAKRCGKGDVVYIQYSGHGQLMTDLNGDEATRWSGRHSQWDESWIPYDAYMTYGENDRGEKHLSDDEVALLLQTVREKVGKKGRITVVVDACHSGDATCGAEEECVRGIDVKFNIPKSGTAATAQPVAENWRTISACKPYQLSTEIKNLNIGKLTYALYSLGKQVFEMSNEQLERTLNELVGMHKGMLPQNPMVSGRE